MPSWTVKFHFATVGLIAFVFHATAPNAILRIHRLGRSRHAIAASTRFALRHLRAADAKQRKLSSYLQNSSNTCCICQLSDESMPKHKCVILHQSAYMYCKTRHWKNIDTQRVEFRWPLQEPSKSKLLSIHTPHSLYPLVHNQKWSDVSCLTFAA